MFNKNNKNDNSAVLTGAASTTGAGADNMDAAADCSGTKSAEEDRMPASSANTIK